MKGEQICLTIVGFEPDNMNCKPKTQDINLKLVKVHAHLLFVRPTGPRHRKTSLGALRRYPGFPITRPGKFISNWDARETDLFF